MAHDLLAREHRRNGLIGSAIGAAFGAIVGRRVGEDPHSLGRLFLSLQEAFRAVENGADLNSIMSGMAFDGLHRSPPPTPEGVVTPPPTTPEAEFVPKTRATRRPAKKRKLAS